MCEIVTFLWMFPALYCNTQLIPNPTAVTWKTPLSISELWISFWKTKPTQSLTAMHTCMQESTKCRIINLSADTQWYILHFNRTQWHKGQLATELSGSEPSKMSSSNEAQGILLEGTCRSHMDTHCASRVSHAAFLERVISLQCAWETVLLHYAPRPSQTWSKLT